MVNSALIGGGYALVLLEFAVLDLGELIAEVVLSFAGDVIAAEVGAADRAYQNRVYACRRPICHGC